MTSKAGTVEAYMSELAPERRESIQKLRKEILSKLPKGFEECMQYGMIGYVVPHSLYPKGYHCNPQLPLPFLSIASQKNTISVYHMGVYMDPTLMKWFTDAHAKATPKKLDMGKSCVRYKKPEDIPYKLIGELAGKMKPKEWIDLYERKMIK
jgi:hypothetical protein